MMAKESIRILKVPLPIDHLLSQLNAALAEEWLVYYRYWAGAYATERSNAFVLLQSEFQKHAREEREHAQLLVDRIIELEGIPVLDPRQWSELARCQYQTPGHFDIAKLLVQSIRSERYAIQRYQEIMRFTEGKDYKTYTLVKHILAEEKAHEQTLKDYQADIARIKEFSPINDRHCLSCLK